MPEASTYTIQKVYVSGEIDAFDDEGNQHIVKRISGAEGAISLVELDEREKEMRAKFGEGRTLPQAAVEAILGRTSGLSKADLAYAYQVVAEVGEYRQYLRLMAEEKASSKLAMKLRAEANGIRAELTQLICMGDRFADADELLGKVAEAYQEESRMRLMNNSEARNNMRRQILDQIHNHHWAPPEGFTLKLINSNPGIFVEAILEYWEATGFFEAI